MVWSSIKLQISIKYIMNMFQALQLDFQRSIPLKITKKASWRDETCQQKDEKGSGGINGDAINMEHLQTLSGFWKYNNVTIIFLCLECQIS